MVFLSTSVPPEIRVSLLDVTVAMSSAWLVIFQSKTLIPIELNGFRNSSGCMLHLFVHACLLGSILALNYVVANRR